MTNLPAGWQTKKVGELADTQLGKMLNKGKQTGKHTRPYLRSLNVQWGYVDTTELNEMDITPEELDKFLVKKGDLLVCEGGESGRVAIWDHADPIGFQNALHRVRAKTEITNKYLYYYFEWLVKNKLIEHLFNGVTIKHFPQENLRSVEINYPPLPEQHKIVEILEDHLSRLDAALADVKQAKVKAAQFRRSLLQVAFTGNLRADASRLMTELPDGWKIMQLEDVADWTSGGTPSSKDSSLYGGEIPWVVIGDLTESKVFNTEKTITEKGLESSSAKILPKGTVMLAMYGASIGRTGIMDRDMSTNQAIACGIPDPTKISTKYLLLFLQSQKQEFIFAGKGGAQPNISQGVVKAWKIPVPPLPEQHKIVEILEDHLSRLDASVALADAMEKQSAGLRRSLLQAAFTGQLTKEVASV